MRVPADLPQVAVRVGEITTVTAPKHILSGLNEFPDTEQKNSASFEREDGASWGSWGRLQGAARASAQLGTLVKAWSYGGPRVVA
jgi:hypothetical protein